MRWKNYRLANTTYPEVRANELSVMYDYVSPKKEDVIFECGTGNGYLTIPLAKNSNKVITYDCNQENLDDVISKKNNLPIYTTNKMNAYDVDKIATIATFHHFEDKLDTLKTFYQMLKPNGKLIIGDIAKGTCVDKYFNAIDNPIHCSPHGHPHECLCEVEAKELCYDAGFDKVNYEIKKVPWVFSNEEEAKVFLNTIHNSQCSIEESLEIAKKHLAFDKVRDKFELEWELFYLTAEK